MLFSTITRHFIIHLLSLVLPPLDFLMYFFPYSHELSENSPCQLVDVKKQALVPGELNTEK